MMGEQEEKSPVESNSMQRVKVYRTNDDGKWDDQGTGHVAIDNLERSEELGLFVIDEEDNETLLFHRISQDDIYRKQDDTIISWRDPEFSSELALSFQETAGCSYIWDQICDVQRNLHFSSVNYETYHSNNRELPELPAVKISTLPLILKRDTVLEIFYEKQLGQIVDVITSSCQPTSIQPSVRAVNGGSSGNPICSKPDILLNICELLCFCVLHHPHRIKCKFLLNNTIGKVLLLANRKEKYLVVATVHFLRSLVSSLDEPLMSHIIKKNLFKPVIEVFVSNGSRYNMLNSAVLDLFHYIRKEKLKTLVKYVIDSFWHQLVKFENLEAVLSLKVKYDELLENSGTESSVDVLASRNRALEKEEDYLKDEEEESDGEDSSSLSSKSQSGGSTAPVYQSLSPRRSGGGDEDYKPPPPAREETKLLCDDEAALRRNLVRKKEEQGLRKKGRTGKKQKKPKGGGGSSLLPCAQP